MQLGPMEFGVFHEFPRQEGMSDESGFEHGFELVDTAERLGLDVMWLAELHISPRSVLASPIAIAAAIAARTRRMKIGTAVQVLPLAHPLRQAEEWATIDQISRGRLIFGAAGAASRGRTTPTASRTPRAATGSPRRWRSSSRRGPSRVFPTRARTRPSRTSA